MVLLGKLSLSLICDKFEYVVMESLFFWKNKGDKMKPTIKYLSALSIGVILASNASASELLSGKVSQVESSIKERVTKKIKSKNLTYIQIKDELEYTPVRRSNDDSVGFRGDGGLESSLALESLAIAEPAAVDCSSEQYAPLCRELKDIWLKDMQNIVVEMKSRIYVSIKGGLRASRKDAPVRGEDYRGVYAGRSYRVAPAGVATGSACQKSQLGKIYALPVGSNSKLWGEDKFGRSTYVHSYILVQCKDT